MYVQRTCKYLYGTLYNTEVTCMYMYNKRLEASAEQEYVYVYVTKITVIKQSKYECSQVYTDTHTYLYFEEVVHSLSCTIVQLLVIWM